MLDSPSGGGFQNPVATLLPGQVTTDDIADGAITTIKVANLAITNAKIDSLSATKLTAGTIDTGTIIINSLLSMAAGADIEFVRNSAARISTNNAPSNGDNWIEFRGNDAGGIIGLKKIGGVELVSAQLNVTDDGFEVNAGTFEFQSGSAAAPSISFGFDPDTGIYRPGTKLLGFAANGNLRMQIVSSSTAATIQAVSGTAVAPSYGFISDVDTGMYLISGNVLGFSAAGLMRLAVDGTRVNVSGSSFFKLPVKTSSGHPTSPIDGDIYVNTNARAMYVRANGAWRTVTTW